MPTAPQTLDITGTAKEFVLAYELFDESTSEPLSRWLEYQAYAELVHLLSARDALPEGYGFETLDMQSVRDWIRGARRLPFSFIEKIKEILLKLKDAGSGIFNDICKFYCAYKERVDSGLAAGTLALSSTELVALIAQYKLDILIFHGIPITAFASLVIKFGVLDEICDCDES